MIWDGDDDCEHNWNIKHKLKKGGTHKENNIPSVGSNRIQGKSSLRNEGVISNFCCKCNAWKGQLGLEPDFNQFISHLVSVFDHLKSKLRDDGSLWVNLADSYYGSGNAEGHTEETTQFGRSTFEYGVVKKSVSRGDQLRRKTQVGIPERFKIAMIDAGWVCRNTIIWFKPSVMPSPVKDRFTNDFEYFFFFTKNPKYYFKQQLEPIKPESLKRAEYGFKIQPRGWKDENTPIMGGKTPIVNMNEDGRNMRTVWNINPQSFPEAHFATFPEKLVSTPIDACCPEKICIKCDNPQEYIIKSEGGLNKSWHNHKDDLITGQSKSKSMPKDYKKRIIGWKKCDCNIEFRKGIVLDPFSGSGTTGLVTINQNKRYIGIEINPEYVKISEDRLKKATFTPLTEFFD